MKIFISVFISTTTQSPSTTKTRSTYGKPSSASKLITTTDVPDSKSNANPTTQRIQSTSKCCATSTKFSVYSKSTNSNKDKSFTQTAKRASSGEKLYVIGIVIPVVVIVCGAIVAVFYLRRYVQGIFCLFHSGSRLSLTKVVFRQGLNWSVTECNPKLQLFTNVVNYYLQVSYILCYSLLRKVSISIRNLENKFLG